MTSRSNNLYGTYSHARLSLDPRIVMRRATSSVYLAKLCKRVAIPPYSYNALSVN